MSDCKVSIIVPVYNVEPYLRRCLDSLVNQTLRDIEIICINDCSPDNALAVLQEYEAKDDRVKVINFEKNQGVSIARNAGLDAAKGEYIGICDSDDYVDLDFYEKLYARAKETDADMVQAGYKQKKVENAKEYLHSVKDKKNKYDKLFGHWNCIYRNIFLKQHKLYYPNGIKLSQDVVFLVKASYFANKIEIVCDTYYHYINRENSATTYIGSDIHNSYGLPLVFDFINEQVTDRIEYGHLFGNLFGHLCFMFARVAPEWRMVFVKDMVEIYKKRKFPIFLEKLAKVFEGTLDNADELFKALEQNPILEYPSASLRAEYATIRNKRLYIWGAGADGISALAECENNGWKVENFLDSNPDVVEFNGYKVLPPNIILGSRNKPEKDKFIIISSRIYANEIAAICERAGLKKGEDFWHPQSFFIQKE